jgi:hypothetical protein
LKLCCRLVAKLFARELGDKYEFLQQGEKLCVEVMGHGAACFSSKSFSELAIL